MPLAKMAGATGASVTVRAVLDWPSTVTTACADVLPASSDGTCRLSCVALVYRILPDTPSKVTPTADPMNPTPMTVANDPGTSAPVWSVAAFRMEVTDGPPTVGPGPLVTVNVTGRVRLPA